MHTSLMSTVHSDILPWSHIVLISPTIQVKLKKLEYGAKVHLFQQINLKGETNILYRLITCKVRYFKPLFVIILMIMAYRHENLFTIF